jgi:hypothetical protein
MYAPGVDVGGFDTVSGGAAAGWVLTGVVESSTDQQEVGHALLGAADKMTIYHFRGTKRYVWEVPSAPVTPAHAT